MSTSRTQAVPGNQHESGPPAPVQMTAVAPAPRWHRWLVMGALFTGAVVFLFPFYYMFVATQQRSPNTSLGGALTSHGKLTFDNYSQNKA